MISSSTVGELLVDAFGVDRQWPAGTPAIFFISLAHISSANR
jgi:hypothetical protein